jgi:formylglycine-generating enzyme required for sulfatase activity
MNKQFGRTVPVGGFPANPFGLHDVHGNVWEWTLDCRDVGYFGVPVNGDAATSGDCALRSTRGGSWIHEPKSARSANRGANEVTARDAAVGFRVARAL